MHSRSVKSQRAHPPLVLGLDSVTEHNRPKWVRVVGTDPNTGQSVDAYDCFDRWLPALLIENAQQSRQTGAAVEQLRNVVAAVNGCVPLGATEQSMRMIGG